MAVQPLDGRQVVRCRNESKSRRESVVAARILVQSDPADEGKSRERLQLIFGEDGDDAERLVSLVRVPSESCS